MTASIVMRAANIGQMRPNIATPAVKRPDTHDGLKSHEELLAAHHAWRDSQPTVTTCAGCGWTFEGTAGEARTRFDEHRADAHPGVKRKNRRASQRDAAMVIARRRAQDAAKSIEREAPR